jgi:hypothetical protein
MSDELIGTADAKLDGIATAQFVWKSDTMRRLGVEIVECAMLQPTLFPDALKLGWMICQCVLCHVNVIP